MKYSICVLAILAFVSCSPSGDKPQPADSVEIAADSSSAKTEELPTGKNCFYYRSGTDTIMLNLDIKTNNVTGDLSYRLREKDANTGSIENGVLYGDTLLADYKFMSEGKTSTRQVAFLVRGDTAIEGYAEMREQKGKMVFKNTGSLRFSNSFPLIKGDCD